MSAVIDRLDRELQQLERRVSALEAPPRIIYDENGFDFQNDWAEDSTVPVRAYLFTDGKALMTGILKTDGAAANTTVLVLPDVFRPLQKIRSPLSPASATGLDVSETWGQVDENGNFTVTGDLADQTTADLYVNMQWFTKYPTIV